ncbi:hypothetical protein chiPu_0032687, partial [Chiloscyllium punctatum]|nr:hypothetical protein [Chiloscyllium punctatum]
RPEPSEQPNRIVELLKEGARETQTPRDQLTGAARIGNSMVSGSGSAQEPTAGEWNGVSVYRAGHPIHPSVLH